MSGQTEIHVANTQSAYESIAITEAPTLEPRDYLRSLTTKEEFAVMDIIVKCESGWKPSAQNSTSTAGGLFQFIDSTWAGYSNPGDIKYNPYDNIRAAIKLYRARGTQPWKASEHCWRIKETP